MLTGVSSESELDCGIAAGAAGSESFLRAGGGGVLATFAGAGFAAAGFGATEVDTEARGAFGAEGRAAGAGAGGVVIREGFDGALRLIEATGCKDAGFKPFRGAIECVGAVASVDALGVLAVLGVLGVLGALGVLGVLSALGALGALGLDAGLATAFATVAGTGASTSKTIRGGLPRSISLTRRPSRLS
jgi:hypothetical protein